MEVKINGVIIANPITIDKGILLIRHSIEKNKPIEKYCKTCDTKFKHIFYFSECNFCGEYLILDNSYVCRTCSSGRSEEDIYGGPDLILCSDRCRYKYEKPFKMDNYNKLKEELDQLKR